MADWPRYALQRANIRMTKALLLELLSEVPAHLRRSGDAASKDAMVTALNAATSLWIDENSRPAAKRAAPRGFDGLTASECNAFLATLPPLPIAGDEVDA